MAIHIENTKIKTYKFTIRDFQKNIYINQFLTEKIETPSPKGYDFSLFQIGKS